MSAASRREVFVAGVGLHPFGRFPEMSTEAMVELAVQRALDDAGLGFNAIQAAYYSHVHYQGMSPGEQMLSQFGLTGIPYVNVENACSSGTTAIWLAHWAIALGQFDCALVVGAERVPPGPVTTLHESDPKRFVGDDHMMATYALRMRQYMLESGAPAEAIAQVAVKARRHAAANPLAQRKQTLTLAEVLGSRMIADPLTLYQCCPTSEGAAAAVLVAAGGPLGKRVRQPWIRLRGSSLRTERFHGAGVENPEAIQLAAREAYEQAGIGPEDIDVAQVHDAATIGEILRIEGLGLVPKGEGWVATRDGETEIGGKLPVNTDGGLLAMGHPFGASGIRMLHETVNQLRGTAGERQVSGAATGLLQCSGAGGVCSVIIASR